MQGTNHPLQARAIHYVTALHQAGIDHLWYRPAIPPKSIAATWQAPGFKRALVVALFAAVACWVIAQLAGGEGAYVWFDQRTVFLPAAQNVFAPFDVRRFINPPWAVVLLQVVRPFPEQIAILAQILIYFGVLTAVIYRFGGNLGTVCMTLLSYIALDAVLQLSVDWMVALGLLVPVAWSGPLVGIKPQIAFGYYAGYPWRTWPMVVALAIAVFIVSFVVWGGWLPIAAEKFMAQVGLDPTYDVSPSRFLPFPVSFVLAVSLGLLAYRLQDPPLGILAGMFVVPYLPFYSLLIPIAMFNLRFPKPGWVVFVVMWLVMGPVFLYLLSIN